eukprot:sb/3469956/
MLQPSGAVKESPGTQSSSTVPTSTGVAPVICSPTVPHRIQSVLINPANKETTNQNSLFRSRDWLSANQGPVYYLHPVSHNIFVHEARPLDLHEQVLQSTSQAAPSGLLKTGDYQPTTRYFTWPKHYHPFGAAATSLLRGLRFRALRARVVRVTASPNHPDGEMDKTRCQDEGMSHFRTSQSHSTRFVVCGGINRADRDRATNNGGYRVQQNPTQCE